MAAVQRTLHPVNVNVSSYSSLSHAVTETRLPHAQSRSHGKPRPLTRRTPVPTVSLTPSPGRYLTWPRNTIIYFERVASPLEADNGVLFSEIQQGRWDVMRHARDPIFGGCSQRTLEFRISWPGYRHLDYTYVVHLVLDGRPVTRFEFARQIVTAYERFFGRARNSSYGGPTKENGHGSWDLSGDLSQHAFVLKAVHNKDGHEGVFQAEIDILTYS
ncbi:hypothetical protein BD414DRAFT_84444 [Trametes punicea]|nr:hypothetical protein BD414DRAFT_84444 [Trametes punicea]